MLISIVLAACFMGGGLLIGLALWPVLGWAIRRIMAAKTGRPAEKAEGKPMSIDMREINHELTKDVPTCRAAMNHDNPMPKTTHENPNLPSARPLGSEIAPCPFCGIKAPWCIQSDDGTEGWVECGICKATGPRATPYQLGVFCWNRRKPPVQEDEQAHA